VFIGINATMESNWVLWWSQIKANCMCGEWTLAYIHLLLSFITTAIIKFNYKNNIEIPRIA
jgi:hypothetical protein